MMLIYVTVCDNAGRDASVLLDISRLTAVAPYTEPSPRPVFYSLGSDNSHRPRNRNYLEVWIGTNKWVVLASEWSRIKAALVRVNNRTFNRFDNDTENFECPHYLPMSATGVAAAREETVEETVEEMVEETVNVTPRINTVGLWTARDRDSLADMVTACADAGRTETVTYSSSR